MAPRTPSPESGGTATATRCPGACAIAAVRRVWESYWAPRPSIAAPKYPPLSSIPRTSPERLAQASPDHPPSKTAPNTILYLAYGSNLSAETFLGKRGIRPISQIVVSAPAFDLTFDLPGFPYQEPCFSNVAPRKIPKPPIDDPTKPPIGPPPAYTPSSKDEDAHSNTLPALPPGPPTWSKGLYGVVYEVTPSDYSRILSTEGGGASYHDVLTPCLILPPPFHVPEKPPIPELPPKPFLAHTLYAPRLPVEPPTDHWWQKLLTPVRRPQADWAQPSLRYLKLIRDGAREHYMPDEYQEYLARLDEYRITQRKQAVGRWVFLVLWMPVLLLFLVASRFLADDKGILPPRLAVMMGALFNLMWMSYDAVFKKLFGEGERTVEEDADGDGDEEQARVCRWRRPAVTEDGLLDEKERLLEDE